MIIIYNKPIPEAYGNLKCLCDHLNVSYHTYKVKKFPFEINGITVHKVKLIRGVRRDKKILSLAATNDRKIF